jgi:protein-S-isoprenylcysteine O-methyltransferase Ste14
MEMPSGRHISTMTGWHAHPCFAALYRWRGVLVSGIGLSGAAWLRPWGAGSAMWSLVPLLAGLALRLWARRHIGLHTRGRCLEAPYRASRGPYAWFSHPLYLANVLVAIGAFGALGTDAVRALVAALPIACFYAVLALGESAFLAQGDPPLRTEPVERTGWSKELWSVLPPSIGWVLLRIWLR